MPSPPSSPTLTHTHTNTYTTQSPLSTRHRNIHLYTLCCCCASIHHIECTECAPLSIYTILYSFFANALRRIVFPHVVAVVAVVDADGERICCDAAAAPPSSSRVCTVAQVPLADARARSHSFISYSDALLRLLLHTPCRCARQRKIRVLGSAHCVWVRCVILMWLHERARAFRVCWRARRRQL